MRLHLLLFLLLFSVICFPLSVFAVVLIIDVALFLVLVVALVLALPLPPRPVCIGYATAIEPFRSLSDSD